MLQLTTLTSLSLSFCDVDILRFKTIYAKKIINKSCHLLQVLSQTRVLKHNLGNSFLTLNWFDVSFISFSISKYLYSANSLHTLCLSHLHYCDYTIIATTIDGDEPPQFKFTTAPWTGQLHVNFLFDYTM